MTGKILQISEYLWLGTSQLAGVNLNFLWEIIKKWKLASQIICLLNPLHSNKFSFIKWFIFYVICSVHRKRMIPLIPANWSSKFSAVDHDIINYLFPENLKYFAWYSWLMWPTVSSPVPLTSKSFMEREIMARKWVFAPMYVIG